MRNFKALVRLASIVITVIVAAVAPRAAQAIEVTDEATGNHCSAMTLTGTDVDGGCLFHLASEAPIQLRKHVFGIETHVTSCSTEFAGRYDEAGEGYLLEQVLSGSGCQRRPCRPGDIEAAPWPVHLHAGTPITAEVTLCVKPLVGGSDETCEIDIPLHPYSNQHRQEYGSTTEMPSHGTPGFRCELIGHWNSETGGTHDGQPEQELAISG
jgi:hypothetical protein